MVKPMLAHVYEGNEHKVKFPCILQPKLDGHRCLIKIIANNVRMYTRTGKPIKTMPHIEAALKHLPDMVLDGELYNADLSFEELTGYIKRKNLKPGYTKIQYWIYDIIYDADQITRLEYINSLVYFNAHPVYKLRFDIAHTKSQLQAYRDLYIARGFEGAMLRNMYAKYKEGRSFDLLKLKDMQDAEYTILDIIEGRGKMKGCAIFVCDTPSGPFTVKMKGTLKSLEEYLNNKVAYIGKRLTVQFQELSTKGIPRFPVGLRVRQDV